MGIVVHPENFLLASLWKRSRSPHRTFAIAAFVDRWHPSMVIDVFHESRFFDRLAPGLLKMPAVVERSRLPGLIGLGVATLRSVRQLRDDVIGWQMGDIGWQV
jgi:hypothetical protein